MLKFPCPDCPVYIMCKNKLYAHPVPMFTICDILESYLFESGNHPGNYPNAIAHRVNVARTFFDLAPLRIYTILK